MNEVSNKSPKTSMQDIIREQQRLDRLLREQFQKNIAVLFIEFCDFSEINLRCGDIDARSMLVRFHDRCLTCCKNCGLIYKEVTGPEIMAAFEDPVAAVKAAMDTLDLMQQHSQSAGKASQIHLRAGINTGPVLFAAGNISGDVVNVASRIMNQAEKDQLLLSKGAYETVWDCDDFACKYSKTVTLKGKAVPMELFQVVRY